MKKLFKYLKNYKLECITAPSFKMLEALFELIVPLVMAKIIDEGIKNKDTSIIWHNGAILIGLGLIGLICSITAQFFAAKAAIGFATGLRKDLYHRIISFSSSNVDTVGTGSLITRMTADINTTQNGVNMVLRLLLRSPFIVFGATIMAFTINARISLIFVIMIPLLFAVVYAVTFITIPRYKKIQGSLDNLNTHIKENLAGIRVVRAFSRSEGEKAEFEKENAFMYTLSLSTARISALLNPVTVVIVNVAMVIMLANGANLVNDATITNGEMYALVNYMSQILVELVKLANLFVTINKSLASAGRIADTLTIENDLKDEGSKDFKQTPETDDYIVFDNVSFAYKNSNAEFIKDVNLCIKKGETIGIIGGIGSGKSTLVNLLMRSYDVTAGEIRINNVPLKDYTLSSLRDAVSIVPQKPFVFSGKLRDNLLLANPDASYEDMMKAIDNAMFRDVFESKGEGLEMAITEGGANLSGGQKQRLTIARALLKKAPILVLDDSSSALDYKTDANLRQNIKALEGLTTFIISQRIVSIKDTDRIIVLDDGKVAGFDTHENLLKTSEVYKEIVNSQKGTEAKV